MPYGHFNTQTWLYASRSILEKILVRAPAYGTARPNLKNWPFSFFKNPHFRVFKLEYFWLATIFEQIEVWILSSMNFQKISKLWFVSFHKLFNKLWNVEKMITSGSRVACRNFHAHAQIFKQISNLDKAYIRRRGRIKKYQKTIEISF